ncbi:SDR family NAD(P)-dependent oxidoreductase [Donghicola tyrosinivorans]|uniref:NAD(P)-dependent dehydrogenase (Short-subunit alcohol dehydrogenase family) n=1 Tax=Donghicola tyrosinivorans TaxID=1652492 RepID=A0A2T0W8Q9_9RHOB|nr:SDR family oxidoreductase [Donghicola tyrosinivorans]PRY83090.1 NAD(P)-dependent dehydrogenase (short-subunit alcohol dehydrogenase family) [Donghicola tyrosinivorans]
MHLSGKTVLLTGATGSIGQDIARELARDGARVMLHYGRNTTKAEALAKELGGALIVQGDLSTPAGPTRLWDDAIAVAGEIHALVNNAGQLTPSSVSDPLEAWHAVWQSDLQVNLMAAADLCRAAIQHFRIIGGGRIVNIASRAGQGGYRAEAMSYGATKAALINLTQSIARGFGPENIHATAIAPGWVKTEMSDAYVAQHGEAAALSGIPIGRMAHTQEIGELVSFVLRPTQASLSGAVLDVNGASQMR